MRTIVSWALRMCGRRERPGRPSGTVSQVWTHSAPGQDALDRVRSLRGGTAARAGAGQTGDVRLPGVHALLWNRPTRKVPGRAIDGQEADASDADRDPG